MSEWIRYDVTLANKPRLIRLAAALKVNRDEAAGAAMRFWAWAQQMTGDGIIQDTDLAVVDAVLDRPGFGAAMVAVGWLEVSGPGLIVPEWDHHLSKGAKERGLAARRMALSRSRDGSVTVEAQQERNKSVTRGEERRGEERKLSQSERASESGDPFGAKTSQAPTGTDTQPTTILQNQSQPIDPPSAPSRKPIDPGALSASERYSHRNDQDPPELSSFYALYPTGRAKNRRAIKELWRTLTESGVKPEAILAGLVRWTKCEQWTTGYAENAEKFLDADNCQWEQEPPPPKSKNGQVAKADPSETAAIESSGKRFAAMPADEQAAVYERIFDAYPNLRKIAKDHPAFPTAIHQALTGTLKRRAVPA